MRPLHTFRGYSRVGGGEGGELSTIFFKRLQETWFKSEKWNKGWLATEK